MLLAAGTLSFCSGRGSKAVSGRAVQVDSINTRVESRVTRYDLVILSG